MGTAPLTPGVAGAIVMGYFTAALLFLRFWSRTQDTLFLIFAAAFGLPAFTGCCVRWIPVRRKTRCPTS